jgi:hypothetical protein
MMNSGAPITGIDRRPLNRAGMDIRKDPLAILEKREALARKNARHHTKKAIAGYGGAGYWHSARVT